MSDGSSRRSVAMIGNKNGENKQTRAEVRAIIQEHTGINPDAAELVVDALNERFYFKRRRK